MDKRKFNGGPREGAGRKRLFKQKATLSFLVEKEDKDKVVKKFGSISEVTAKLRQYFEEEMLGVTESH